MAFKYMLIISNIFIVMFGASAIWFISRKNDWRKYGYLLGLLGQPFWLYSSIVTKQWGMLILTFFYIYSWSMGIYNNFIFKKNDTI